MTTIISQQVYTDEEDKLHSFLNWMSKAYDYRLRVAEDGEEEGIYSIYGDEEDFSGCGDEER